MMRVFRVALVSAIMAGAAMRATAQPVDNAPSPIPVFVSTNVGNEIDDQWVLTHLLADPRFNVRRIASAQCIAQPPDQPQRMVR